MNCEGREKRAATHHSAPDSNRLIKSRLERPSASRPADKCSLTILCREQNPVLVGRETLVDSVRPQDGWRRSRLSNRRFIRRFVGSLIISVSLWGTYPASAQDKPLSQTEAVRVALQQSPQARAAKAVRDVAQVQAERDRPIARPTLNVVASGTAQGPRVTFPRPDYTPATILPEGAGRLDLVLEQTLYRAGIGAARQRYEAEAALAVEEYRRTLAEVALSVRKAYVDVLRAEAGVQMAQDGMEQAARYQQVVQKQIDAGVAKPIDAETVRAQVVEATGGLHKAQGGLELARQAFNYALGRPLLTPFALEAPGPLPLVPDSPDTAIAYAQQGRPELITLELNLRLAQAGVSLARTQSQPIITARGQFTEQTPTALLHEHYYGATLEVRFPLLDGGKTRQDTREAQSQVERVKAERDQARQGIELAVRKAWQTMRDANDSILLTGQQRESQEKTLVVALKAYEVGQGTVLAVQAAQREARNARESEMQATYDLYAAAADFAHAQGRDAQEISTLIGGTGKK
jgi:outer membrane protein